MRPGLRAALWLVALVLLAVTLRQGVLYALSVEPPPGFDALDLEKPERARLVVAPAGVGEAGAGSVVVFVPADGNGTRVARVAFEAAWNATGGYDVPAANATNATSVTLGNATWALPATLGNGTGLFVHADDGSTLHADGEPLVAKDRLEGTVVRVEDGGRLLLFLAMYAVAAVVPVVVLISTQRPKTPPAGAAVWDPALAPSPPTVPCVDCGRPVPPSATFCTGCGAYLQRPGPEDRPK